MKIRCNLHYYFGNEFGHLVLQHGERIYFEVCDLRFQERSSNVK